VALIGDGVLRSKIQQMIQDLHLSENIDLLGYQNDIDFYIQQSKVFILTSQTEGLPTVLFDALNHHLPMVVPNVGDILDVAQHNVNALVVEPLNVDQFVQSCVKLLTDEKFYRQCVANIENQIAIKKIEHGFNHVFDIWDKVLNRP